MHIIVKIYVCIILGLRDRGNILVNQRDRTVYLDEYIEFILFRGIIVGIKKSKEVTTDGKAGLSSGEYLFLNLFFLNLLLR